MDRAFVTREVQDLRIRKELSPHAKFDVGELIIWPFLRPCRMKILMLVDANISFNHAYFGLSAVLDTLQNNPEFYVKFDVTRAHRQTDPFKPDQAAQPALWAKYGPHHEDFSFTQAGFNINDYHQVWFFGFFGSGGPGELEPAELDVLTPWMNAGGGVFATGDHAELGAALCSNIPRVKSMRRWTAAQGVPSPTGTSRHDTLRPGSNATYTFDDESDDQPMPINVRLRSVGSWSPFLRRSAPHPILCGKDGIIDILPDHPHEGECLEGAAINLAALLTVGAAAGQPEYPTVAGVQPGPEVIATAFVRGDHTGASDLNKGAANGKEFGVIGVYEGQEIDHGRVVVDSTWHHWFDVNLTGRPVGSLDSPPFNAMNPKTEGFFATPAGEVAYARIQNYFRNVAIWLAPKPQQRCMLLRATWWTVLRYPLVERLDPRMPLWELGGTAKDALGRSASQCLVREWLWDFVLPELRKPFLDLPPDPCLTCPPFDLIEIYLLGGVVRETLSLAYALEHKRVERDQAMEERPVLEAVTRGLRIGAEALTKDLRASLDRTRTFSAILEKGLKLPTSDEFFGRR